MRSASRFNAHETGRLRALEGAVLAPFWPRAIAFAIDVAAVLLVYAPIAVAWKLRELAPGEDFELHLNPFHDPAAIPLTLLYFGLTTYIGRGQTPGKRLLKLRVVSTVHERLSLWHCIERTLGYGASMLEGGFGFMQYFFQPNHRTVHDRIAETIVVSERAPGPGDRATGRSSNGG
jgi:uncharacterized RDD family membrane protein YckC